MRRILHIAIALLIPSIAIASSFTRPYGASNYLGGGKAVGPIVNAEFAYISNWLNGGNIASGNIAALGVLRSNMEPVNLKVTDTSSNFTGQGPALVSVTNLSTTLTTVGRPVAIQMQSAFDIITITSGKTTIDGVFSNDNTSAVPVSGIMFLRNSATVSRMAVPYHDGNHTFNPCASYSYIDQPSAGTHTYAVAVSNAGSNTTSVYNCRLVVRAL
jgi:hypothetical protein